MKITKLLRLGIISSVLSAFALCMACNKLPNDAEDMHKLTKLLEPINVLGDSFELEAASKKRKGKEMGKENVYKISDTSKGDKYVYVVEFTGKNNRQKWADKYAKYLRNAGEEVNFIKVEDRNLSAFYSLDRKDNISYLFISKFINKEPNKVLKNEYAVQLSSTQDNKKYIRQIVDDFIKTDMINIRPIIIEKQGNITNVKSY